MNTTNNTDTRSPILRQYEQIKEKHPDAVLLFRTGEFYTMYHEDAETASRVLGITKRTGSDLNGARNYAVPFASFPRHALDTYLPRLVRAGCRVAICDQLEQPSR